MKNQRLVVLQLFCVLFCLVCGATVHARGSISGQYLQKSGQEIVLELRIGSPAPASFILKQQLPPGTSIIQSTPVVKKYTPVSGKARWLFTGLKPGKLTVSLQLEKPLQGKPPEAEIRCKDPATGQYVTTKIH